MRWFYMVKVVVDFQNIARLKTSFQTNHFLLFSMHHFNLPPFSSGNEDLVQYVSTVQYVYSMCTVFLITSRLVVPTWQGESGDVNYDLGKDAHWRGANWRRAWGRSSSMRKFCCCVLPITAAVPGCPATIAKHTTSP